jgi:hypothetical protein
MDSQKLDLSPHDWAASPMPLVLSPSSQVAFEKKPYVRPPGDALVLSVMGNHLLMRLLGSYLDKDSIACLYLALPPNLRKLWFTCWQLASWAQRDPRESDQRRLRMERASPLVDLRAFLSFTHLHQHSNWNFSFGEGYPPFHHSIYYQTHLFRSVKVSGAISVVACLFLPSVPSIGSTSGKTDDTRQATPPPPFAGNLVVLEADEKLLFYAPTVSGFRLTATVKLGCSPHSLARSPSGRTLLAAHENAVLIQLKPYRVACTFTGVSVRQKTFLPDCFVNDEAFVTGDAYANVWIHTLTSVAEVDQQRSTSHQRKRIKTNHQGSHGGGVVVLSHLLLDNRSYGPTCWPFSKKYTAAAPGGDFVVLYKQATEGGDANRCDGGGAVPDCLVMAVTTLRAGLGHCLRLRFAPAPSRHRPLQPVVVTQTEIPRHPLDLQRDVFVYFRRALVASMVLHPSHQSLFVVVMTKLDRNEFFTPSNFPLLSVDGIECYFHPPLFDDEGAVEAFVGVYELRFPGDPGVMPFDQDVAVLPRWYLDGIPPNPQDVPKDFQPRTYKLYRRNKNLLVWKPDIVARCNQTHLVVRLSPFRMVHLPLASAFNSTEVYMVPPGSCYYAFDFSQFHSFGASFPAIRRPDHFVHYMCKPGMVACVKHNRFFPDVTPRINTMTDPPQLVQVDRHRYLTY